MVARKSCATLYAKVVVGCKAMIMSKHGDLLPLPDVCADGILPSKLAAMVRRLPSHGTVPQITAAALAAAQAAVGGRGAPDVVLLDVRSPEEQVCQA